MDENNIHPIGRLLRAAFSIHQPLSNPDPSRGVCSPLDRDQVCALNLFGRWLKRTGREVRDLTEAVTCDFLRRVMKGRLPERCRTRSVATALEMLRQIGATPAAKAALQVHLNN